MRSLSLMFACGLATIVSVLPQVAQAHFLWVEVKLGDPATAEVYFNEGPTAGSARLAAKIAPTKATVRTATGSIKPIELQVVKNDDDGHLAGKVVATRPYSVDAQFEYGIFRHEDQAILLNYYASHIEADKPAEVPAVARAGKLPLVIIPQPADAGWLLTVLWQGQPAPGCELVVEGPGIEGVSFETDAQGQVALKQTAAGEYAIRVRKVEDRAGDKDGQAYETVHHYATLTARLEAPKADATVALAGTNATATSTADEVLASARDSRAVWDDFPGFTANVDLRQGQDHCQGRIKISEDGEVELTGFGDIKLDRVQQILESMVQHRTGGGGPVGGVTFVDQDVEHPLGRMIRFDDDKDLRSAYRVENDVVTEVNRQMGPMKMTISVLDVYRNPAGKYLPTTFNVSFWDKDSGKLTISETHLNDWIDVQGFDLPRRFVVLRAQDGKREVVSLDFTDHALLKASGK